MLRFSALTMPLVTVLDRPSGAPMATAVSPTLSLLESANCSGWKVVDAVDLDDGEVGDRVGADDLRGVQVPVVGLRP